MITVGGREGLAGFWSEGVSTTSRFGPESAVLGEPGVGSAFPEGLGVEEAHNLQCCRFGDGEAAANVSVSVGSTTQAKRFVPRVRAVLAADEEGAVAVFELEIGRVRVFANSQIAEPVYEFLSAASIVCEEVRVVCIGYATNASAVCKDLYA